MKQAILAILITCSTLGSQGCAGGVPDIATIADVSSKLIPQILDVYDFVESLITGDLDPAVIAEINAALAVLDAEVKKIEAQKGSGALESTAVSLEAISEAYTKVVKLISKHGLATSYHDDNMKLAAGRAPAIPTFELLKKRAGISE